MAEETKTTETASEQAAAAAETTQETKGAAQTEAAKKYTDDEVNGIVARKTKKAVDKFLSDLGITDRPAAEQALKDLAAQKAAEAAKNGAADAELQSKLQAATDAKDMALLESVMLISGVQPAKIGKAVRLVELQDCRDEDGVFNREKAKSAVEALLKDWGELKSQSEDTAAVGFKIGADGKGSEEKKPAAQKKTPQKPWNRFNY